MKRKEFAKLAVILSMALSISSCKDEPDIYMCAMVSDTTAQCIPSDKTKKEFDMPIKDMLGYICVSPDHFGEIKKHHNDLHKQLDKKAKVEQWPLQ